MPFIVSWYCPCTLPGEAISRTPDSRKLPFEFSDSRSLGSSLIPYEKWIGSKAVTELPGDPPSAAWVLPLFPQTLPWLFLYQQNQTPLGKLDRCYFKQHFNWHQAIYLFMHSFLFILLFIHASIHSHTQKLYRAPVR